LAQELEKAISNQLNMKFSVVADTHFPRYIFNLEARHPAAPKKLKMAIIYSLAGQSGGIEMFSNNPNALSPSFLSFLELMGDAIEMLGWKGYCGDMSKTVEHQSLYTTWGDFEIMFHAGLLLESVNQVVSNKVELRFYGTLSPFLV